MAKDKGSRPPSPWADKPYTVGKGKPPVASQFKPGQKPPKAAWPAQGFEVAQ